ncbi:hypothetical protein D9M72_520740 [compost metagenome]
MLSRHKAHPCRQVPAILEVGSITNSGNDCRCNLWADATDLGDALADLALAEDGFDLLVEVSDLFIDLQQEGMEGADDITCQLGDIDPWIADDLRYRSLGDRGGLYDRYTALEKQAPHLGD